MESSQKTEQNQFQLTIADNGVGFTQSKPKPGHYGFRGMEEQAVLINGRFSVKSNLQKGTTIIIEFEV